VLKKVYQVVILEINPEKPTREVIENLGRIFKIDPSKFKPLSQGNKITVCKNIDKKKANIYKDTLEKVGCKVLIKPLTDDLYTPKIDPKLNVSCPKCGYIRKSTDCNPEYECPKCGVIYAKVNKIEATSSSENISSSLTNNSPNTERVNCFIEGWNWYLYALSRKNDNGGRSTRKEYFYFGFFMILIIGLPGKTFEFLFGHNLSMLFGSIILIFHILPSFNLSVRRMQDGGHSGYWLLVPIVNLLFALQKSQPFENQYGPVPESAVAIRQKPNFNILKLIKGINPIKSKRLRLIAFVVVLLVIIGELFTVYINSRFNSYIEDVNIMLNFYSEDDFNKCLNKLTDLMNFTANTVYRYKYLPDEKIQHFVGQTIEISDLFIRKADEESENNEIYGYSLNEINKTMLSNQMLLLSLVDEKIRNFLLVGYNLQGRFLNSKRRIYNKIMHPKPMSMIENIREQEKREREINEKKDLEKQKKMHRAMEIMGLRQACKKGATWACDELKNIESGNNDPPVRSR